MIKADTIEDIRKADPMVPVYDVVTELVQFRDSLTGDFGDDLVASTIETAIDIILEHMVEG